MHVFDDDSSEVNRVRMDITLVRLSCSELYELAMRCERDRGYFPSFCAWFARQLANEAHRRDDDSLEPGMEALPKWTGKELADALEGSFHFVRCPLSENQARVLDQIHLHIMASCSAVLQELPTEILI